MDRMYNIGGVDKTLAEAKMLFPYGIHDSSPGFLFHAVSYAEPANPNININHGWKLHADLRKQLSLSEALGKLGISPRIGEEVVPPGGNLPPRNRLNFDIVDQDLFEVFKKRFHTFFGYGEYLEDSNYFSFISEMLNTTRNYETAMEFEGVPRKFINPDELFAVIATIGKNDINYKMDHSYGPGRMLTLYGQSIEERDRIISILENSKAGQYLEDADDPAFRATIDSDIELKNTPVSKKFRGRFTTDYMHLEYADERGLPYLDLSDNSNQQKIDSIPRGLANVEADGTSANKRYSISGNFTEQGQIEAIERVSKDFPEMSELLHGKEGYVSPYATIEDLIEYRTGQRIQVARVAVNPIPPAQKVVNPVPEVKPVVEPEIKPVVESTDTGKPSPGAVKPKPEKGVQENNKKPVISTEEAPPAPTKPGAEAASNKVVDSGTAPQGRIVVDQTPKTPTPKPKPSSGAPGKNTVKQVDNAASAALAKGIKGADSLRMLGAAAILGVGAGGYTYARRRTQKDNIDRRLEMQRRGIIS